MQLDEAEKRAVAAEAAAARLKGLPDQLAAVQVGEGGRGLKGLPDSCLTAKSRAS